MSAGGGRYFQQIVQQFGALAETDRGFPAGAAMAIRLAMGANQAAVASTILTLALAPMRVAPAAVMVCEIFAGCECRPKLSRPSPVPPRARISATSCAVAPAGPKPVEVLTKSAPASFRQRAGHRLLIVVEQRGFENHLHDRAARARRLHHCPDIRASRPRDRPSAARRH